MEVDEIQSPQPQSSCKYSRVNSANGRIDCSKIGGRGGGSGGGGHDNGEENELDEINQRRGVVSIIEPAAAAGNGSSGGIGGDMIAGGSNRFGRQWQHSSRIIRVSRASGGKDRHSKVWTAKGPRDRRVRLSVTTAIQFYDLQDRLGYDQPSKAVEWLIKAAQEAINELPALNTASFPPETPRQLSDERRGGGNGVESTDVELDGDPNFSQNQNQNQNQNQQHMGAKLGCSTSNNSETSKGSGLSLSRSEIRVKARERARERMAKEKDRDGEPSRVNVGSHQHHNNHHQQQHHQQQNVSSMPQTTSFTQLLTAGMNNLNESNNAAASSTPSPHHHGSAEVNLFHKHSRGGESNNNNNNQWLSTGSSTTPMADYFGTGLMGLSSSRAGQIQLGHNTSSLPPVMTITSFGGSENQHQSHDQLHHHHQHFPFLPDQHLIQVANTASRASGGGGSASDYNLNFTVSSSPTSTTSGLAAGFYNRGTLQSNSPSLLPYLQRFSATDGSSLPFFLGSAAVSSASPAVENHHNHHHHQQFQPPGLQLCYGDGGWPSDQKGKGKN